MTIRQRRIEKGWSQLQLAEFSGLSLRTIQRIEKGLSPNIESLKSLAAVFDVNFNDLIDETDYAEIDEERLSDEETAELKHVREVQKFLRDLMIFFAYLPIAILLSFIEVLRGDWLLWGVVGWAAWLAWGAFDVFDARDFLGKGWEKRQLEKRLGRKVD